MGKSLASQKKPAKEKPKLAIGPVKHEPSRDPKAQPERPASKTELVVIRKTADGYRAFPKKLRMSRTTGNIVFVLENAPPNAQLIKIDIEEPAPSREVVDEKHRIKKNGGGNGLSPSELLAKQMAPIQKIAKKNGWRMSQTKKGYLIEVNQKVAAKKSGPLDLSHPFSFPSSDMRVMLLTDNNRLAKYQGRKFKYEMFVQEGKVRLPVDPEIANDPPPEP